MASTSGSSSGSFITLGSFEPSSPRCAVCWTTGEVHKYEGKFYCERHLDQRVAMDQPRDPPRYEEDGYEGRPRFSIGLDSF